MQQILRIKVLCSLDHRHKILFQIVLKIPKVLKNLKSMKLYLYKIIQMI